MADNQDLRKHCISDAELSELADRGKAEVAKMLWFVIGVFLGSVIPAVKVLGRLGNPAVAIPWLDLFVFSLCVCSFILVFTTGLIFYARWGRRLDKIAQIRDRP